MPVFSNVLAGASGQTSGGGGDSGFEAKSLRFGGDAYMSKSTFNGNQRIWTLSFWYKRPREATLDCILSTQNGVGGTPRAAISFDLSNRFRFSANETGNSWNIAVSTAANYIDPTAWSHYLINCNTTSSSTTNRVMMYVNGVHITDMSETSYPGYNAQLPINQNLSHLLGAADTSQRMQGYLSQVHFVDGQQLQPNSFTDLDTTTGSYNPKQYTGNYGSTGFFLDFSNASSAAALGYDAAGSNNWTVTGVTSGPAANYVSDITYNSGSGLTLNNPDRIFDGTTNSDATISNGSAWVEFNPSTPIAYTSSVKVMGSGSPNSPYNLRWQLNNGSLVNGVNANSFVTLATGSGTINKIRGQVDNGGFNWRAIEVDGVVLKNVEAYDIDVSFDSPSLFEKSGSNNGGNYATFNRLQKNSAHTLSNAALELNGSGSSWKHTQTTFAMKTGKWYCEFGPNLWKDNNNHCQPGVSRMGISNTTEMGSADATAFYHYTGVKYINGPGGAGTSFGNAWNNNTTNVIGIAFDADTRKVWFSLNGVWQGSGNPAAGTNEAGVINYHPDGYSFGLGLVGTIDNPAVANFGATGSFKYTAPTGFNPCSTQYLDTPSVQDGNDQFQAILRSGFGTSGGTVTTGFKPGLLWEKTRSTSGGHYLYDALRGVGKILFVSSANPETNDSNLDQVSSFTNTGYTLGGNEWGTNVTLVGWAWKDGATSNTSVSAGSINSSCYNTSAVWSNSATATLRSVTGNYISGAFNGRQGYNNSDEWTQIDANNTLTFAPSGGISNVSTLRVYAYPRHGTLTFSVNGTQITSVTGNVMHAVDLSSAFSGGAGTLTNLTITSANSGSYWGLIAVEVNDKYLVDSNVTPPNAPQLATTHRVNDAAGMSVVTYTANRTRLDSIAHGLGKKPHFAIFKNRDSTLGTNEVDWGVYHHRLSAHKYMELNHHFGQQSHDGPFYHVEPDVNRFYFGTGSASYLTNGPAGDDFLGLIFTEIPGFSKFGVYTGTGTQLYVEVGFRPAWVMIKRYTDNTVGQWSIYDNKRDGRNEINKKLWADSSSSEEDHPNNSIAFVSNGFVLDPQGDSPNVQYTNNGSVGYLYACFAESPFKTARAV